MKRQRDGGDQADKQLDSGSSSNAEIRYLELYAGVGGWTMALKDAVKNNINVRCIAAWDHSDLCRQVYTHNYNDISYNNRIEELTCAHLSRYNANMWLLSPPCQPHTRQHDNNNNDLGDARSASFAHLCKLLSETDTLIPDIIVLENVVGFESSQSCILWRQALTQRQYYTCHFHLTPTQVGVPNDRPRYYCVAVQRSNNDIIADNGTNEKVSSQQHNTSLFQKYFTFENDKLDMMIHTAIPELDVVSEDDISTDSLQHLVHYLDKDTDNNDLTIPESVWQKKAAWCFDIVTPKSHRTACFTSGYGKWIKGTGSVLYTGPPNTILEQPQQQPQDRHYDSNWAATIDRQYVRYFSGTELARLFGYTSTFTFPTTITQKQQYKLVGNSINVKVASKLIQLALLCQREA